MTKQYAFCENVTVRPTNSGLRMLFDRRRGVMYELNETASSVIGLIDEGQRDVDELVDALGEEYEAPADELRADIEQLIADFVEAGLLQAVEDDDPEPGVTVEGRELPVPDEYQLPEQPMPIQVQLGLTYRCNLKCKHCYALYRRDLNELTLPELEDLLAQLYDAGSCTVVYSHGENLIRKDFHDFARLVRERGMYQTLMANGYYVRDEDDATRLCDSGVDRVLVSLDSSVPDEHDAVRGRDGAYGVALRAVSLLKEAGMPFVGFSTTIDRHNYEQIPQIVDIARDLGIDGISFMQNRYNRPGVFDRLLWKQYVAVCRQLYELMLDNRGRIDLYTHDPFMLRLLDDRLDDPHARADFIGANICNVATGMVSIDPVGNVTGCNFIEEVIGNVRDEPFADIWDRLVGRYSDTQEPPSGPCSSCGVLDACMGGCKAFHYNGKYDERCGETRFAEPEPHGLEPLVLPLYPTAPAHRKAGVYAKRRSGATS